MTSRESPRHGSHTKKMRTKRAKCMQLHDALPHVLFCMTVHFSSENGEETAMDAAGALRLFEDLERSASPVEDSEDGEAFGNDIGSDIDMLSSEEEENLDAELAAMNSDTEDEIYFDNAENSTSSESADGSDTDSGSELQAGHARGRGRGRGRPARRGRGGRGRGVAPIAAHRNAIPGRGRGAAHNRGRERGRGAAQNYQPASGYNDIDVDGPGEFPVFNPGDDVSLQLPENFQNL